MKIRIGSDRIGLLAEDGIESAQLERVLVRVKEKGLRFELTFPAENPLIRELTVLLAPPHPSEWIGR